MRIKRIKAQKKYVSPIVLGQGFSTSGSRPHLGSPSDFRGVARLSTNLLKNDGIFKY